MTDYKWRLVLVVLCSAVLGACYGLSRGAGDARPTPQQPVWDLKVFEKHLQVLNSRDVGERIVGMPRYERGAIYVRDRMREYMLQPGLKNQYLIPDVEALNVPGPALLQTLEADTVHYIPGLDFLPDGRTDEVQVTIRELTVVPTGTQEPVAGRVVLLRGDQATSSYLRALRAGGTRAVLIVGALDPRPYAQPVDGVGIIQVTPQAAGRLIGLSTARAMQQVYAAEPTHLTLPRAVQLRLTAEQRPSTEAFNVFGYVAGRHPIQSKELVLVCADLTLTAPFGDVRVVDFADFGIDTAALLETAHNFSAYARRGHVPERTLLFGVWLRVPTGERGGLFQYLSVPLWAVERTRAVVYVGLEPEREPAVRAMLQEYGIPLYVVSPPETPLFSPPTLLIPQGEARRLADQQNRPIRLLSNINMREIERLGSVQAQRMAEQLHTLLLREAITPGAFKPAEADTLVRPGS